MMIEMTENKRFKQDVIDLNNIKKKFERSKREFKFDCEEFMRNNGIKVKLMFFGDSFGLDISNVSKIPLNILVDFCEEFGCTFEYTNNYGQRYFFSFDGLSMEFNL